MKPIPVLLLLSSLVLAACAGGADECRLERVATLPLVVVQKVPVVTVQINGQPARLVIDTGSDATVLNRAAAARLGVADTGDAGRLRAAGGAATAGTGRLGTLAIGADVHAGGRVLLTDLPAAPMDGLLGISTLIDYELELDVPQRQATFYKARGCVTARPDWPVAAGQGRIVQLPAQQQAGSGHLYVPLAIDGQPLRGMLDSGASVSTLSLQSAEDAGLTRRRLTALPQGRAAAVNAGGLLIRHTRFRTLQVGPDVLEGPELTIGDLPSFAGDLLLGEDYIGTRRMWFSFRLGRVYVLSGQP